MLDARGIRHFIIDDGYSRVDTVEREAHWAIETRLSRDHLALCHLALRLERYYIHFEPKLIASARFRKIAGQLGIDVLQIGEMIRAAEQDES